MLRKFFLSALAAAALLATTETASAQATPAASRQAYRKVAKAQRVLSKREKQAAEAQARAEQARAKAEAATVAANTTLAGWGDEPLPAAAPAANGRAVGYNMQSAAGMPLNQIGHGVSTDYDGRPIRPASARTLPTATR